MINAYIHYTHIICVYIGDPEDVFELVTEPAAILFHEQLQMNEWMNEQMNEWA